MKWGDKRFYSLNYFYRNTFGDKTIKIPLDAGLTCPNRDGTKGVGGCIFCGERGSGESCSDSNKTITEQFLEGTEKLKSKWGTGNYIPYFQAYTNTYGNIDILRKMYFEALSLPNVVAISIATRPDCLNKEVLELLEELSKKTYVFIELGLQTSNEKTAEFINRCYKNEVFEKAVKDLKNIGINVVCHLILGLPNETVDDMLNSINYICEHKVDGVKLQLLYVQKNTRLEDIYFDYNFETLTYEQYIDIVVQCVENLSENIVVHRLTGDAHKNTLVAPKFLLNKRKILNEIDRRLMNNNSFQCKMRGGTCVETK